MFILEEFRKKQKKSNMSDNLQYFLETSCKATGSDTSKVKDNYHTLVPTLLLSICNVLIVIQKATTTKSQSMLHGPNRTKGELFLLFVPPRSRSTIQGGSPGINRTSLRRQSKSQSLSLQRRSSSNSRESTLAGSTRITKMHQGMKDRDCIHCGNAKSCFAEYTFRPG